MWEGVSRITDTEFRAILSNILTKMIVLKESTFSRCLGEAIYRACQPYTSTIEEQIREAVVDRLIEFKAAWLNNRYRIKGI